MLTQHLNINDILHLRLFKVGGITFIQLGRIQLSFCLVRRNPWREHECRRLGMLDHGR